MEEVEVEFGIVDFEGVLNDDDTYSVSIRGGELRIFKLKRKPRFWGGICLRERFVSVNEDDENGNLERERDSREFMLAGKFKKGFDRWDNFYVFHLNFVLPLDGWVFAGPARSTFQVLLLRIIHDAVTLYSKILSPIFNII